MSGYLMLDRFVPVLVMRRVGPIGGPAMLTRKLIADWMTDEAAMLKRQCASIEFAFPSTISRGVLTAILWMASAPMPTGVHATSRAAIEAALGRTGRPVEEASTILRAIDALT